MKICIFFLVSIFFTSCGNQNDRQAGNMGASKELLGAGASFPYPLYSKMFSEYAGKTGVSVNYQSIGSGGGVRQLMEKTIDFGASDAFLTDEELKAMPAPVVHIPTCIGSVAVSYNLPGNPGINLTPELLAAIFLGKIKKWNDPAIASINPGVAFPDTPLMVIHRSDGSGTTFVFTDYLSKVSPEWSKTVGSEKSVNWPTGLGGKGNEGVSGLILQTPGALGYVELVYALQNNLIFATLKNRSGRFIRPSLESTHAAAAGDIPADTRVSITNAADANAYPISSFSWILLYKEQNYDHRNVEKARELVSLLQWMIHEGQQYNNPLKYAALPKNVTEAADALLKAVTYNNTPLLK